MNYPSLQFYFFVIKGHFYIYIYMKIQNCLKWYLILLVIRALSRTSAQGEVSPKKPVFENSLRILTASIAGMRHWSQFKDRVSYLFEIFGQLIGDRCHCFLNWGLLFVTRVINLSCLLIRQPRWTRQLHWAATEQRLSSWEMERRSCSVSTMKMWGGKYVFIKKWKYKFRFFCDVPGKGNSGFVVVLIKNYLK